MSEFKSRLQALLRASSLTPGVYEPSEQMKTLDMAAVLVAGKPVLLTGGNDAASLHQAERFAKSKTFKAALASLSLSGEFTAAVVQGSNIEWPVKCEVVAGSAIGMEERDGGEGELKMISLHASRGLTALLCVNTELARIIDPQAPELDDGRHLTHLMQETPQVLTFH